jgi:hypothetical protein
MFIYMLLYTCIYKYICKCFVFLRPSRERAPKGPPCNVLKVFLILFKSNYFIFLRPVEILLHESEYQGSPLVNPLNNVVLKFMSHEKKPWSKAF